MLVSAAHLAGLVQPKLDALQGTAVQQHNQRLLRRCKRLERQEDAVMAQVREMQDKCEEAEANRAHLQNEVDTLRKTMEVRHCPASHPLSPPM